MIADIPNRPLYSYQKDIIGWVAVEKSYPMGMTNWKVAIERVDSSIEHGDFPHFC